MACVLLADESKAIRDILRRGFLEEGFAFCVEAANGKEAVTSHGCECVRFQSSAGKAIKFAGLHGKEVRIIGKNRETLTTAKAAFLQYGDV